MTTKTVLLATILTATLATNSAFAAEPQDTRSVEERCANDNPNVDAGNEDSVLKDALYREVMGVFLKRIEARKRGASR